MKASLTFLFLILFAIVVVAYLTLTPPPKIEMGHVPEPAVKVLPLDEGDEVRGIDIHDQDNPDVISLVLEQGVWQLTSPVKYPAESLIAEGLVHALTLSSKARRLMPEKPWSEYGLENPLLKIGVRTKLHPESRVLLFGDHSPVGEFVYARWAGEREYFLMNDKVKAVFRSTVYSLREKKAFRSRLSEIEGLKVRIDAAVYEIAKRDVGWLWVEPIPLLGKELSKSFMDELLTQVRDLYVKEFLEDGSLTESQMGLVNPEAMIGIFGKQGSESEILWLGFEVDARDGFYAKREGEKVPFLVASRNVRRLMEMIATQANEIFSKEFAAR